VATRGHSYRITVAPLTDATGEGLHVAEPLTFTHINHDDVIVVVERVRKSSGLDPDAAAATAVGLKLLSEAMLKEKGNSLFDPLRSGVREFIQNLKSLAANGDQIEVKNSAR
jgi:hypothetical protein